MARTRADTAGGAIEDYRHGATRKNNPPAGLVAQGQVRERPKVRYSYDPHSPPLLRFDATGRSDALPELLAEARRRPLTEDEARQLAEALQVRQPWLEWAGKREARGFEVDPVALNIHERVATRAIIEVARRKDVQRTLFADPEQSFRDAVQFYQHDVAWANRLILGDSLAVMSSLAKREDLAGKVQMIYVDPPYGIKFASNFQSQVGQRDVKDRPEDLTREPEMVKAYRDTWNLGVHSYLAYLRDRLIAAKELLTDSGSIFVQISDENVHRVRQLMDEVFGPENYVSFISFVKTSSATVAYLAGASDYLVWYARDIAKLKYRQLFLEKKPGGAGGQLYTRVETPGGQRRFLSVSELSLSAAPVTGGRVYRLDNMTSQSLGREKGEGAACWFPVHVNGKAILPNQRSRWKTNESGMSRLLAASRIEPAENSINYVRYLDDFPVFSINNSWTDTGTGSFTDPKVYVVQTGYKVIERCMLMTTDPGDLVLDPTCGSGTTAYVAEQWGRRWITIDTSRVALAIARQRILTASFPFYRLRDERAGVGGGFVYKSVPHITLKSIAQNPAIDSIAARHAPVLAERLAALNAALALVTPEPRTALLAKLMQQERAHGRSAITDADRRRWQLPKDRWQEWEVPFAADPDWPAALRDALTAYRAARRAKIDEIDAAITANAEQEELVDQPEVVKGVTRVAGPFTVESVLPPEESLDEETPIEEPEGELAAFADGANGSGAAPEPANAAAYLDRMTRLLRADGVRFPNNQQMTFNRLDPLEGGLLDAEGEWAGEDGRPRRVAVSFGPEYGPVTAVQVEDCIHEASREYDDLVFAGFSFDAEAQATIQEAPLRHLRLHLAHIRPDVTMGDLLETTPNSQLFTVFGAPRVRLEPADDGEWRAHMEGVDVYDPVSNNVTSTGESKVAAWFVDSDYDGRCFCICQAFFPDKSAWEKLARALKGTIDAEAFAQLSGTVSLPFRPGVHRRVAVKVIDPRGNEVMCVRALKEEGAYA